MTEEHDGSHPIPQPDSPAAGKPVGPRLVAGVGEQPRFATERLAAPPRDPAALWKQGIVRVLAVALAILILWGVWRWWGAAREQREPCINAGLPPAGCDQPPGLWRQGQFLLAIVGVPIGVATAVMAFYGAAVQRRVRWLGRAALTYLVLLVTWIAMHFVGRWVW